MPLRLTTSHPGFNEDFGDFAAQRRDADSNVADIVSNIIAEVRARGDQALLEFTDKFDGLKFTSADKLRLSDADLMEASNIIRDRELRALKHAAERIYSFHEKQFPPNMTYEDDVGVKLGVRWTPVEAVGIYVPGGTAAYPSSVLMNAIPAKVAGVKRVIMAVPSSAKTVNPLVLEAARLSGVDEIYRVGGAQAVAALAYGTETIVSVDKITGPGNAYVTEAKRQVFGRVGIDMIAGPSEILVVADAENDPSWIAADLISQAEHDVSSQSVLITDSAAMADAVSDAVNKLLSMLPRGEIARESWETHGCIILVANIEECVGLVNRLAPEHVELAVQSPKSLSEKINNAGTIFLGHYTPEAVGDYVAGPNHVLPTSGNARFSSGLSTMDFMKRTTFVECDKKALERIGPDAVTLANAEGLDAHALSVSMRLRKD